MGRIVGGEDAADERANIQERDHRRIEEMPVDSLCRSAPLGAEVARRPERQAKRLELSAPLAPGQVVTEWDTAQLPRVGHRITAQDDQAIGIRQRKRQDPEGMQDAERGRVGAQAEGQR